MRDRMFIILFVAMVLIAFVLVISTSLRIGPNELQVPVRYSSFGVTHFYRDKWYYLITFVVAGLAVAILHTLIALKLYDQKGRDLALMFMWLGVGVVGIASFIVFALFKVVSLS